MSVQFNHSGCACRKVSANCLAILEALCGYTAVLMSCLNTVQIAQCVYLPKTLDLDFLILMF